MAGLSAALVQAAIDGEETALGGLPRAAQPDIRRYARRTCRASDIDDAVQEALWLLSRRIGSLRAGAFVLAWLFTVVRRECLRLLRSAPGTPADDVEERTIGEIAEALDLTREAVKARLHRARALLREFLSHDPVLPRSTIPVREP